MRVLERLLLLVFLLSISSCYEIMDDYDDEYAKIAWVYCILDEDKVTQSLELKSLSRSGMNDFRPIEGADVSIMAKWTDFTAKPEPSTRQSKCSLHYSGNGIWECETSDMDPHFFRSYTELSLQVCLPSGDTICSCDSLLWFSHGSFNNQNPELPDMYHIQPIIEGPGDFSFRLNPHPEVWVWLDDKDDISTNREDLVDAFNKYKQWHYKYLRFVSNRPDHQETQIVSVGGYDSSETISFLVFDTIGVFSKQDGIPPGCINFLTTSVCYGRYLRDVAQLELVEDCGSDLIGIYNNSNVFSNIKGGIGIFGAAAHKRFNIGEWRWEVE